MDKPFYKKWWFWLIVFIVMVCIGNIQKNSKPAETYPTEPSISEELTELATEPTEELNEYMIEITWALDSHYMCAVEIDDYDGDILEAGTYRFYPTAVVSGTGKIPTVWDIYVSDKIYDDVSQLHDDNPDFVGCVGGLTKEEITVNLEKGQYIYVKYYGAANNNPTGILKIEKQS